MEREGERDTYTEAHILYIHSATGTHTQGNTYMHTHGIGYRCRERHIHTKHTYTHTKTHTHNGSIDGTPIAIKAPSQNEFHYVNRAGFHS